MSKVLVIPDLHIPFQRPDALAFCQRLKKKFRPDHIVCTGDLVDFYAFSRYDQDPDSWSPGDELRKTREALRPWFKAFPKVRACWGNHDLRLTRKLKKAGIPAAAYKTFEELLDCPKAWRWDMEHTIDGVKYFHGDGFTGKNAHINAAEKSGVSSVIGHAHSAAGITFLKRSAGRIFGMNSGCLVDYKAYAFAYARQQSYKPVMSAGFVKDGQYPQVIPMI